MPQYLKNLNCTLYDLAMNFHGLMIEENAKHFTIEGFGKIPFWYITDVTQLNSYPCHSMNKDGSPAPSKYVDYLAKVTIHFN